MTSQYPGPARTTAIRCIAVLMLAMCCHAPLQASAGGGQEDIFVIRQATDMPLEPYARGELGIVLPSYPRVYLYPAWRAIMLGRAGLAKVPASADGQTRAVGSYLAGWLDISDTQNGVGRWVTASDAALGSQRKPVPSSVTSHDYGGYVNCPETAFDFAAQTLAQLQQRKDATPQRIQAWIQAQDLVFNFCELEQPGSAPGAPSVPRPRRGSAMPDPLPANEPQPWRHWRDYQIAAAHFYAGHFDDSAAAFRQIGHTASHPMQPWGAYLALRSRVRQTTIAMSERERMDPRADGPAAIALKAIESQAQAILNDASLKVSHEAVRATVRTAQYRMQPIARFEHLSAVLADPARDPYQNDHLGDWRRLANDLLEPYQTQATVAALEARLRQQHEYFDWIRTIQRCTIGEPECQTSRAHAQARWDQAAAQSPSRRAWLVAMLLVADALPAPLETAAREVPDTSPEYLTVRYNLSRLYRDIGQADKARQVSEAALATLKEGPATSHSADNLLRQQRFAVATSVGDAAAYLLRMPANGGDADTGEKPVANPALAAGALDADGLAWINGRLPVKDLLTLATDKRLGPAQRQRLALAAWMRAELLGDNALTSQALAVADAELPALKAATRAYRQAASPQARRHAFVLFALRSGVSPNLQSFSDKPETQLANAAAPKPPDSEPTASMWCGIGKEADRPAGPVLDITSDPDQRDKEIDALRRIKTATGFVGDHVLQHAKAQPNDPELPWLLHVVIQSTRGGCLDQDSKQLSRAAHTLLHRRFGNTEWARKSPYWY